MKKPARQIRELSGGMNAIQFTVASALFNELGERLVGKPYIALAELVKNSYDADATKVIIRFGPDLIEVFDNGHGMDFLEFRNFWMRIGTPHKQQKHVSRKFKRPMTGSKGVGRLAVQFLASQIELRTVSEMEPRSEIEAHVNWNDAVKARELTKAVALYKKTVPATGFPDGERHGTAISLSKLKQNWSAEDIVKLAREIWWLQPPFRNNPNLTADTQRAFEVEVVSPNATAVERFKTQIGIIRDIWYARLIGKLIEAPSGDKSKMHTVHLSLEFAGESPNITEYAIPECSLRSAEFEIRVFHLKYKQPHGISVSEARDYLNEHGGVRVYDAGFHLPFYGQPENDWLGIEIDHSHRLSKSKLLPDGLHIPGGMEYLPTQSRLLGVVHVSTSGEQDAAQRAHLDEVDYLKIAVTRDRLVENRAFQNLRYMVRYALDFYAMQEVKRGWGQGSSQACDRASAREIRPC